MSRLATCPIAAALAAVPALLGAQDVVTAAPAHYRVLVDNAHVRVVEGTLRPGEKDGLHTHPAGWYYVTQGGAMKIVAADGRVSQWTPKTGESFWGDAEAPHTSENVGRTPITYVLVAVTEAARVAARSPR
jgi:beta-alanine degradation protein BauB